MLQRILRYKSAWVWVVILAVGMGLIQPAPVGRADPSPDPWAPGNNIGPTNPTQVRMLEEYVQIDLLDSMEADPAMAYLRYNRALYLAKVQANFTMKNLGTAAEAMQVYFPLGLVFDQGEQSQTRYNDLTIADFQVWVDGQPVNVAEVAVADERSPHAYYVSAQFPVRFPLEKETLIRVTYTFVSTFVAGAGSLESFGYIFQTGAGWKDSIGKAVLSVNLPHPSSPESVVSSPEGAVVDEQSMRWTWTDFEPTQDDNFEMLLAKPGFWDQIREARLQLQKTPRDGAVWTKLGALYLDLAFPGRGDREFPRFTNLAQKALQMAAQLSPYDPEPHRQLFNFYAEQSRLWWTDWTDQQLAQPVCAQMVNEINQFILRSAAGSEYDQELGYLREAYDRMVCPNKPKLTSQRGIYPTLTPGPQYILTGYPTMGPMFEAARAAYEKMQDARFAALFPTHTPLPTMTYTPTETARPTRTATRTAARPPEPTGTATAAPTIFVPQVAAQATLAPVEGGQGRMDWVGIVVIGALLLGAYLLWEFFMKRRGG